MPRPVDPERHRARRLQIIDAGLTAFSRHGYAGATTAVICRTAGVGSGTLFHYFPTKDSLLVAILELGTTETREFFAAQEGRDDSREVLLDYVRHAVADLRDERAAGFIAAVGGVVSNELVATALRADEEAIREGLTTWTERAQSGGQIRTDLSARQVADWIALLLDGFADRITAQGEFDADRETPLLLELTELLLDGRGS
ncbi:TetR/AcrR family transcriptional regulator [Saccharopolyspora erythraea]|uniref:TetR/AcrR family transcriptional regulator n=1 Tax=Saccharopolyspora erythraea TaxID=1836 RepID=UPI001BA71F48|nr:TetR/AcrR family transcriptional regulator [Saccharopolyspora erythraea]QUH03542.1 TetR/AcrR family transcriptional regulator [Saccharopolyspora erythraea]